MGRARDAITDGRFPDYLKSFFKTYYTGHPNPRNTEGSVLQYPRWCVEALRSVGVDILDGIPEARIVDGSGAKWDYAAGSGKEA